MFASGLGWHSFLKRLVAMVTGTGRTECEIAGVVLLNKQNIMFISLYFMPYGLKNYELSAFHAKIVCKIKIKIASSLL